MRVALVSPRYAPAIGGVERCVEMLARGLVSLGVDVEVATTDPSGMLQPEARLDGVLVRRFPTVARDGTYFVSPRLGLWLMANVSRFDVVHVHSLHTPLPLQVLVAAYRRRVPVVVSPYYHGTGHTRFRRALHVPYRAVTRMVWRPWRYSSRVICISQCERDLLHKHFGRRLQTEVIPVGVDVGEIGAAKPFDKAPGQVLVLAAGRLERYKQIDKVMRAVRILPENYKLAVVGDGPMKSDLDRLARDLNLDDRIRLLGQLSRADLLSWYRTSDVFVSLSRHESFGMMLLEAAAGGNSVVASDIPAHREVSNYLAPGTTHFVGNGATEADIAAAIRAAVSVDSLPSTSRMPTWPMLVKRTLDCYLTLTKAGS